MDYTKRFVVYNKIEIIRLENKIAELERENEKLKEMGEKCRELEFENVNLKNQLNQRRTIDEHNSTDNTLTNGVNGSDQSMTMDFIQSQEVSDAILKVNLTPNHITIPNGYPSGDQINHEINTNITDVSNDSSSIPYVESFRRKSIFNIAPNQKKIEDNTGLSQSQKAHKLLGNVWSFPNLNNKNGLSNLSKEMRNKCDKNIMFKIIANQWNKKPENMSRMEFFYHLLMIFFESGVLITFCSEHSPPCRPKVDTKIFEKNADVLKSFVGSVNRSKLIIIEVELLVALENLVYTQPKYRPAISDIMDILFRKGVVEAVAFGEWSQMESQRSEDKTQLIREIKASGFSLLKRSTSL